MTLTRQMTFWVLTFVVGVLVLYVLREILLPFVAGMALAYLFHPLANRALTRLGREPLDALPLARAHPAPNAVRFTASERVVEAFSATRHSAQIIFATEPL